MLLSEVINLKEGLELLKEGEFTSLGLAIAECEEKILTFIESEKYISGLSDKITALITTREIGEKLKDKYGIIISESPRYDYFKLHNTLSSNEEYKRESFNTTIGEGCKISKLSSISDTNVVIGNNVIIEEFVVIRENTVIGDNSIIRAGVILGGEGYEYKRTDGIIMNVNHCGGVIIGDYSKLDDLVHIEHGVKVGERCLIASRSTFGGRTVIGSDSWVGLGAIISNGLVLGSKVSISLGAVVTTNLKDGEKVSGNFAINHDKYIDFIKKIR